MTPEKQSKGLFYNPKVTLTFIDRKEATERRSPKMSLSNEAARSGEVRSSEEKKRN